MKTIEYKANVLPDGHLSLPKSVKKRLRLETNSIVKVKILKDDKENRKKRLEKRTGFCGSWEDERTADEIIYDIYSHRTGFGKREINL